MCFYFVFTVFGTVGFGDIVAVNTSERVRPRTVAVLQCCFVIGFDSVRIDSTACHCSYSSTLLPVRVCNRTFID
jgi:hypothetical protein